MTSGCAIVNFEQISRFILLLFLLNLTKFQTIKSLPVTLRNKLSNGLGRFAGLQWFFLYSPNIRLWKDNFSQCFKKISRTQVYIFFMRNNFCICMITPIPVIFRRALKEARPLSRSNKILSIKHNQVAHFYFV